MVRKFHIKYSDQYPVRYHQRIYDSVLCKESDEEWTEVLMMSTHTTRISSVWHIC